MVGNELMKYINFHFDNYLERFKKHLFIKRYDPCWFPAY